MERVMLYQRKYENGNPVEEPYAIWDDENDKFVLLNKVGEQYDRKISKFLI